MNFKNKSTGQLSAATTFLQFAGTSARVFTTLQEVDDRMVLLGFLAGLGLNGLLFLQMICYWNSDNQRPKKSKSN
jgi:mannose-P-dolichol utilization defect protein 1